MFHTMYGLDLATSFWLASAGPMGVGWIDVGQGAALLAIGSEGDAVLIDSGPADGAEAVIAALQRRGVHEVDLWIHTHLDADHVGGATRVRWGADGRAGTADDMGVKEAWDRGSHDWPATTVVSQYGRAFASERRGVEVGRRWEAPGIEVSVVGPPSEPASAENERSLALCLRVGDVTVLVLGDLPATKGEEAAAGCLGVDVLWASHHGAADGLSAALVSAVRPSAVVISAGRDNAYCHPSARTLALLSGITVWVLDGAGLGPKGPCQALASVWGPRHTLVAGDVWLEVPADAR